MSEKIKKVLLTDEERRIKVEEAIRFFQSSKKTEQDLYNLISNLTAIYNDSVPGGREMDFILSWVASFPDN
jgi:hypothetical protein